MQQARLDELLAAAAEGDLKRVEAALQPPMSREKKKGVLSSSVGKGQTAVAALLLDRLHWLPLPEAYQSGSLRPQDSELAKAVRVYAQRLRRQQRAPQGSVLAGPSCRWAKRELRRALAHGYGATARALLDAGVRLLPRIIVEAVREGRTSPYLQPQAREELERIRQEVGMVPSKKRVKGPPMLTNPTAAKKRKG